MSWFQHIKKRTLFWASWPFLCGYFLSHSRSRVLLTSPTGKVLLVQGGWKKLFDDDGYGLPGGGINYGELPAVGAARELSEELAISVAPEDLTLLGDKVVREYGLRYRAYFYQLEIPESQPLTLEAHEIDSAQWYDLATVKQHRLKPEVIQAVALVADTP